MIAALILASVTSSAAFHFATPLEKRFYEIGVRQEQKRQIAELKLSFAEWREANLKHALEAPQAVTVDGFELSTLIGTAAAAAAVGVLVGALLGAKAVK